MRFSLAFFTICGSLCLCGTLRAGVIISDNFARGTPGSQANLGGSSPSADAVSSTDTWTASGYTTDGSEVNASSPSPLNVTAIPFDLAAYASANPNAVVTFSLDVSTSSPAQNTSWIAMGFEQGTGGIMYDSGAVKAGPWMLLRANGGTQEFAGPDTNNQLPGGNPTGSGTSASGTLKITYNTATRQALFFLNGTQVDSTTYTSTPADKFVGFDLEVDSTGNTNTAAYSNFMLSSNVPEPATASLLLLAGTGLLSRRRCRKLAR